MSKASSVVAIVSRNSLGREFHSLGPSTENSRRPHEFRRYDGTTSWWPAAELIIMLLAAPPGLHPGLLVPRVGQLEWILTPRLWNQICDVIGKTTCKSLVFQLTSEKERLVDSENSLNPSALFSKRIFIVQNLRAFKSQSEGGLSERNKQNAQS